jgi:hypothetical protein
LKHFFNETGLPSMICRGKDYEPCSKLAGLFAVTVTYGNPVAGITAPTAAQALNTNRVSADIIATADADTTATLVTNFALSAASLAAFNPVVIPIPILQAPAALSLWAITSHLTSSVVATKATTASSGNAAAQLRLHALRHSYLN